MSTNDVTRSLVLPEALLDRLHQYRRLVWRLKLTEAVCGAVVGIAAAFLVLFTLDRIVDTHAAVRWAAFAATLLSAAIVPCQLHRWVWRYHRPEQLARLLARRMPRLGDQLLGVIELVRSPSEQLRSPALCRAAVDQVSEDAARRDLDAAAPPARQRRWGWLAAVSVGIVLLLVVLVPVAAGNAFARMLLPWGDLPRFTFAVVQPLPERLIVPHGEPYALTLSLAESTRLRPAAAQWQLAGGQPQTASLSAPGSYTFELPPLVDPVAMRVQVGDAIQRVWVEPSLRPELTSIQAEVMLPEYLQHDQPQRLDVRGGSLSVVKGSRAALAVTANRTLASAQVDAQPRQPRGAVVASGPLQIDQPRRVEFRWQDQQGLSGHDPLVVNISAREDQAPAVSVDGLPRRLVVLDSQQLSFEVQARDDFGVRQVGLQWEGISDEAIDEPTGGERLLAAGGPRHDVLEATGTFSAKSLGIEPQVISLRVFVEDYFPGRPRVYSAPSVLIILDPSQHSIWLTNQLNLWHRASLEVRDRERQLHETNKQLRQLPAAQLDQPEVRRQISEQAAAERNNARRLAGLTTLGEELIKQASRNPEFGVGHLESWAEMLQVLKDIGANRMPSVADLLATAAAAPAGSQKSPPMAGHVRASGGAGKPPAEPDDQQDQPEKAPQLVDVESSQQPPEASDEESKSKKKEPSSGKFGLPTTTLQGPPQPADDDDSAEEDSAEQALDQAVQQQADLLAEFDRLADELEELLGNLEGATLVKRLKAASRTQAKLADAAAGLVDVAFGAQATVLARIQRDPSPDEAGDDLADDIASRHDQCSHDVSTIMDDLDAYYERRRLVKFRDILAEMRSEDVIGGIRHLGDAVQSQVGMAVALAEFWSDTLDRWAEDLVDPACSGECPGGKSPASLPPSIVLEVLQILEGEVNLREETRVVEQARPALAADDFQRQAGGLADQQEQLRDRVDAVAEQITELPDGDEEFADELSLLAAVSDVMAEARDILARPDTGSAAIGAETEAIELLLQSKRCNPSGGGGGGAAPGGGGEGTTADAAIALLGTGTNEQEVKPDRPVSQATGRSTSSLPEEFRAGLDEYFNRLERLPGAGARPAGGAEAEGIR